MKQSPQTIWSLKRELESQRGLFLSYFKNQIQNDSSLFFDDPVFWINSNAEPEDKILWSFLIAGLTYGRVEQIKKSVSNLEKRLLPLGMNSGGLNFSKVLMETPLEELKKHLSGWRHRLNTEKDLCDVFSILKKILAKHGGFASFLKNSLQKSDSFVEALDHASKAFQSFCEAQNSSGKSKKSASWKGTGVSWFFPTPKDGGTCKRLMMWFRWLTRTDPWEIGVWANEEWIKPKDLFTPVDTHILQWALKKSIVKSRTPNWKTVVRITDAFKKINPNDPLAYDYCVCHSGMAAFRNQKNLKIARNRDQMQGLPSGIENRGP